MSGFIETIRALISRYAPRFCQVLVGILGLVVITISTACFIGGVGLWSGALDLDVIRAHTQDEPLTVPLYLNVGHPSDTLGKTVDFRVDGSISIPTFAAISRPASFYFLGMSLWLMGLFIILVLAYKISETAAKDEPFNDHNPGRFRWMAALFVMLAVPANNFHDFVRLIGIEPFAGSFRVEGIISATITPDLSGDVSTWGFMFLLAAGFSLFVSIIFERGAQLQRLIV